MEDHGPEITYPVYADMIGCLIAKGAGADDAAFLMSLIDVGDCRRDTAGSEWVREHGWKVRVDLDFVAIRMIRYCWETEVALGVGHSRGTVRRSTDIVWQINEHIRRSCRGNAQAMTRAASSPPSLGELASRGMARFRRQVVEQCIRPMVRRGLPIDVPPGDVMPGGERCIDFDHDIIDFMHEFGTLIRAALCHALALHLEGNDPSARHVATKVDQTRGFAARRASARRLAARERRESKEQGPAPSKAARPAARARQRPGAGGRGAAARGPATGSRAKPSSR